MTKRLALHMVLALALLIGSVLAGLGHAHHDHGRAHSHAAMAADAAVPDDTSDHAGADQPDCQHAHCHTASVMPSQAAVPMPRLAKAGHIPGWDASLTSRAIPVHERPPRTLLA